MRRLAAGVLLALQWLVTRRSTSFTAPSDRDEAAAAGVGACVTGQLHRLELTLKLHHVLAPLA
jgi:hypothetical protein